MTQMYIFYHAMNYNSKRILDAAFGGALRRKSTEEGTRMIEELAKSNYRAPSKASGSSNRLRSRGVIELNKMTTIEANLDAIMNRMNNEDKIGNSCNEVGIVEDIEQTTVADLGLAHEGSYQVDEV